MAFLMRKKKYKFVVLFTLEELSSIPFKTGQIFVKCRLLDGGSFNYLSHREEVKDHKVKWNSKFDFTCKMSANPSNGILDSTLLRLSVRKEVKGGRSSQKLGFVELDLAEFAGSGQITKRYLLEGYDNKNSRQDNSTLKVTLEMNLLCGDPLFKRPLSSTMPLYPPLYRNDSLSEVTTTLVGGGGGGGGGRGDKTNSLDGDGLSSLADVCPNSAIDDETSTQLKLDIRDIPIDNDCYSTRIDSVQLINQLVEETNLERYNDSPDDQDQEIGLKLIVSKDGTTSLTSGT